MSANLSLLVSVLARSAGIETVMDAMASTFSIEKRPDGVRVIRIPTSVVSLEDSRDEVIVLGGLAHEALGHGRFSNMEALTRVRSPLEGGLFNILEDVRIEALAGKALPGAKWYLAEMARSLASRGWWDEANGKGPEKTLQVWLLRALREQVLGQDLGDNGTAILEKRMGGFFGAALTKEVADLGKEAAKAKSSDECLLYARLILERINQAKQDQQDQDQQDQDQQDQQDQGQQDQQDQQDQGQQDQQDQGQQDQQDQQDQGQQDQQDQGQQDQQDQDQQDQDQQDQQDQGQQDQQDQDQQDQDQQDQQDQGQQDQQDQGQQDQQDQGWQDRGDGQGQQDRGDGQGWQPQVPDLDMQAGMDLGPERVFQEVASTISQTRPSIPIGHRSLVLLKSDDHQIWPKVPEKWAGRIADAFAVALPEGERFDSRGRFTAQSVREITAGRYARPFVEYGTPEMRVDTELNVLVDVSGSMDAPTGAGDEIRRCTVCAAVVDAICTAASRVPGLDVSVALFNQEYMSCLLPGQGWESPDVAAAKDSILRNVLYPSGATLLAEAVNLSANKMLSCCSKERRVILVITDDAVQNIDLIPAQCAAPCAEGIQVAMLQLDDGKAPAPENIDAFKRRFTDLGGIIESVKIDEGDVSNRICEGLCALLDKLQLVPQQFE